MVEGWVITNCLFRLAIIPTSIVDTTESNTIRIPLVAILVTRSISESSMFVGAGKRVCIDVVGREIGVEGRDVRIEQCVG